MWSSSWVLYQGWIWAPQPSWGTVFLFRWFCSVCYWIKCLALKYGKHSKIRDCSRAEQSVCFWVSQEKCFTFLVLIASLLLLRTTCVAFFNVGCPYEYDWVLMNHQLDVMLIGEIAFSYSLKSLSQRYKQWCSPSSLITWWQKGE
jgi:hypothetical protein